MKSPVSDEAIAAAEAYEQLHVPALFRQWAHRTCEAAELRPGQRVLDVACGTGVVAREAVTALRGEGFVAGLDADPGMIAVADRLAPQIEWRTGQAEAIPYDEGLFDAVVSQFGLMFFQDRVRAIEEMLRVLAPGGRLAVAVWDSLENSEAYSEEVALLDRVAGTEAGDALRAPFALGNQEKLRSLFESAGAASVNVTAHRGTATFPNIRTMVEADLRGWLPVMGVDLPEDRIDRILNDSEHVLSRYVTSDRKVKFESSALMVTVRKEPGSRSTRER